MASKAPTAVFPPPAAQYDRANEAAFRMEVQRYLQEVASYPATVAGTAAHAATHASGGADELSHSVLADLTADDHTQYMLVNATRAFSAQPYWGSDPLVYGPGTVDYLPVWLATTGLGDSIVYQDTGQSAAYTADFTYSDSTDMHLQDGWWATSYSNYLIFSNVLNSYNTGTTQVRMIRDIGYNDGVTIYAEVTRPSATYGSNFYTGFVARITGTSTLHPSIQLEVRWDSGVDTATLAVIETNGAGATITSDVSTSGSISWADAATKRLVLTLDGTTVTGEVQPSGGGTAVETVAITATTIATGTYAGVTHRTQTNLRYHKWDDFTVLVTAQDLYVGGNIVAGTWLADTIGVGYGGTGLASYTAGDMLYASGTTVLAKLGLGTSGYFLKAGASAPAWAQIAETDIADGSVLARLAANETVTGSWIFSGTTLYFRGSTAFQMDGTGSGTSHLQVLGGSHAIYMDAMANDSTGVANNWLFRLYKNLSLSSMLWLGDDHVTMEVSSVIISKAGGWLKGYYYAGAAANLIRGRGFGYNPAAYDAIQVGAEGAGLALFVDPGGITGGAFSGSNNELLLPNVVYFLQANSGGTDWINPLVLNNGTLYPGVNNSWGLGGPSNRFITGYFYTKVDISGDPNPHVHLNDGTYTGYLQIASGNLNLYHYGATRVEFDYANVASAYYVGDTGTHIFYVNSVEKARIDASGVKGTGGFQSSDGSAGITQTPLTLAGVTSITIKDGIITGYA